MNIGYALNEVREHGNDLQWWRKRFLTHIVSRYYDGFPPERSRVVDLNWDNLLLLDACRYDLFEEVLKDHPLPGDLSMRKSSESGTPGYLRENFEGEQFHDIVYVTANPYVNTNLPADTFHAVVPVWDNGWDDDEQTVLPETMLEAARDANEQFPDKRLIVHFNQPHAPFIGDERLGSRQVSAIRQKALGNDRPHAKERTRTPFEMLGAGEVTREEVWIAYRSNLLAALPAVETLLEELPGRTAVTADHGNALGEWARPFPLRVYGHPLGILIPALIDVPWFVHDDGPRKSITAEPPIETQERDGGVVEYATKERLRMLGYAE